MADIRALLFDFDGVIVETEEPAYLAWSEVYAAHGQVLEPADWANAVGTLGGFDAIAHLEALMGHPVDDVEALREQRAARKLEMVAHLGFRPGIQKYLDDARRLGLQTAIVTSDSREWIESHLNRLDRLVGWDLFCCADGDRAIAKPSPHLYLAALDALGIDAELAIAIEDSPNGIAAAKAAGLFCVATPNPITRGSDLGLADLVLDSLEDLPLEELMRRV